MRERNPPVTALLCQPFLGKGPLKTRDADCHDQFANWSRNDMVFYRGCRARPVRADRGVRPYGQLGGWYGGPMWASAPTESYHGVRRGGALPRPRATARVAPTEGYKRCGEVRYHPGTASPCQPSLGKGPRGRGMRIATTSLRTGLAMTPFTRGAVQHRRADRGVRPYGGLTRKCLRRIPQSRLRRAGPL